jgi:signal transduction histidine kinase
VNERGHVRVLIEDNGRGIPSDAISKIFLPFFTTKTHGTGLGLSLVQKIVLAHNGRIEVESTEGKGTRFTITLPKS